MLHGGVGVGGVGEIARARQLGDRLEREVRVHRARAVADEEGDVGHLARFARLDHEPDANSLSGAHQRVMNGARREQARDRGVRFVDAAIAQNEDAVPFVDRPRRARTQLVERRRERLARVAVGREQHRQRRAAKVVERALGELRQLVVRQYGVRQLEEARLLRRLGEQVPLAADAADERHHELLADRIDRRVGDLGELLLEIAEEQLRTIAEDGERGVRPHAADGLFARVGHRREDHAQVFACVAERPLEAPPLGVRHRVDRRRERQGAEHDFVLVDPRAVRLPRGDLGFDLFVADDAPARRVDQEHLARLKAPFLDDVFGGKVEHPELAREHDEPRRRDHVLGGAEAVAIERRADERAVGEDERRWAIPRLDERAVVLVKRALGRAHVGLRRPRLGHEHHHHVGEGPPARDEKVDHVVERRRVAAARADDRLEVGEVLGERVASEHRLAGRHPALVAAERVDLAVVGDAPVGVRALPRGEGVRAEARVHDGERRGDLVVLQIEEEGIEQLREGEPFVDEGAVRQARHVKVGHAGGARDAPGALANHEERPLERRARAHAPDEELLEHRHARLPKRPDDARIDRHVAPADDLLVVVPDGALERAHLGRAPIGLARQEHLRDAVVVRVRDLDAEVRHRALEERVRHLDEDARAVAGARIAPGRAAMREAAEHFDPLLHHVVRRPPLEIGDEAEAAGVVLEARVVEALGGREGHSRADYGGGGCDALDLIS